MPNEYQTIYFQLPAFLFSNYAYRKLSLSAKVTYALLQDRLKLSKQRHWQDSDGETFIIFTNQELMDVLGLSEHTVIKIKQELARVKLLRQQRMGVNQPNRLYLPEPNLTPTDIYVPHDTKKPVIAKHQPSETTMVHRHQSVKSASELDFSQKNYSAAEIFDQNKGLLHHSGSFLTQLDQQHSFLLDQAGTELLGKWCQTPAQLSKFVGVILGAKKQVSQQLQVLGRSDVLDFDNAYQQGKANQDLKHQLTLTLQKYFNAIRRAEDDPSRMPIRNHQQYLYRTMVNFFDYYANECLQAEQQVRSV